MKTETVQKLASGKNCQKIRKNTRNEYWPIPDLALNVELALGVASRLEDIGNSGETIGANLGW